ncbi:MAG: hypothetical protein A2189_04595 [Paenibacillus sp. RIFOXYA1_FULL_44_5]|nr:MAG: hypothetical protein A2189_04595 [Paenibacillus sp. RIFOXYA1_FULL_44_5]
MFDHFYDISEQCQVNFVGFATENTKYDFSIVYTNHFFGKPLVVCMQTGKSSILSLDDLADLQHLQKVYNLPPEGAKELSIFLQTRLSNIPSDSQYE